MRTAATMSTSQPGRNFRFPRGKPASTAPWTWASSWSIESCTPKSAPTATRSRVPPSATCKGTPRRFASSTHQVMSSAARANWLPLTRASRSRRSCDVSISCPMMRGATCARRVWKTARVCSAEYPGADGGQLSPHAWCPPPSMRTRIESVHSWLSVPRRAEVEPQRQPHPVRVDGFDPHGLSSGAAAPATPGVRPEPYPISPRLGVC